MTNVLSEETPAIKERALRWWRLDRPIPSLLAMGALTRLAVIAVAWVAGVYLPGADGGWNRGPGFVRYFARWDSGFYMDIGEFGYTFKPEAWAFDPGYPLATRAVWLLVPRIDLATAGFLVSNAAFLAAIVLLYTLTARLFDERVAWRASVFAAVFPGSFYLSAVYADSLFLALALGAFLAITQRRWLVAGALVSLAAFTRPPGFFLIGAFGLALLLDAWKERRVLAAHVGGFGAALVLPLGFMAYGWRVTGDLFVSEHARERYWPNVQWHDPLTLVDLSGVTPPIRAIIFGGMVVLVACVLYAALLALRRGAREAAPAIAFTLVASVTFLAYAEPNPIVRYLVCLPPLYWMLAEVSRDRGVFIGLVAASAGFLAVITTIFATWGPLY